MLVIYFISYLKILNFVTMNTHTAILVWKIDSDRTQTLINSQDRRGLCAVSGYTQNVFIECQKKCLIFKITLWDSAYFITVGSRNAIKYLWNVVIIQKKYGHFRWQEMLKKSLMMETKNWKVTNKNRDQKSLP